MDLFKEILKILTPLMKQIGLTKKGNNFYVKAGENYGIINLQKSRESNVNEIKFTINFGVYSAVLGRLLYDYSDSIEPEVEACHWQSRVGTFMLGNPDFWWKVNTSDTLSNIISNVMGVVQNTVIPELNKRLSDEDLINTWMIESYAGTTELCRFKNLTTLLKTKNDFNTLNKVVATFLQNSKGNPNFNRAIEHLKEIKYNVCY